MNPEKFFSASFVLQAESEANPLPAELFTDITSILVADTMLVKPLV